MGFRITCAFVMVLLAAAILVATRSGAEPYLAVAFSLGFGLTVWAQFAEPGRILFFFGILCVGTAIYHESNLMVWFLPGDGGELYAVDRGRAAIGLILLGIWSFVLWGERGEEESDGEILTIG